MANVLAKTHSFYLEKVKPWLEGCDIFDNIPSYDSIRFKIGVKPERIDCDVLMERKYVGLKNV